MAKMPRDIRFALANHPQFLALFLISLAAILKFLYAISRPIFYSGPDANGYIPMALDLAQRGFLSSEISGLPVYPIGYGAFLSVFAFSEHPNWIQFAQLAQILLISVASYFFFSLTKFYFNKLIAYLTLVLFLFHPAIFTMSTQAMYEPLLISIIISLYYATFYVILNMKRNELSIYLLIGTLTGLALVIHPRSIFILFFPFVYTFSKLKNLKHVLSLTLSTFSVVSVALMRNFEALGVFSISTATKYSIAYGHKSIGLCNDLSCYSANALDNLPSYLGESARNLGYFFTPYSGPLKRGTWFHNLSLLSILDKVDLHIIALIFSGATIFFVAFLFIIGAWRLFSSNKLISYLAMAIVLLTALTDAAVYGDSRHRLLVIPFMIPIQIYGLGFLIETANSRIKFFRRKVPKSWTNIRSK